MQFDISLHHELVKELERGINLRNKEIPYLGEKNKILHQTVDMREGQLCQVNRENTTLRESNQSLNIRFTKEVAKGLMRDYTLLKKQHNRLGKITVF